MRDIIFIEGIHTQAVIGVYPFERAAPQRLIVSVELGCDITAAAASDDVNDALDYDKISQFIDQYVRASDCQLLERLAEQLVSALFEHFLMSSIKLRLQKPGAILLTQQVGLVIYRERS